MRKRYKFKKYFKLGTVGKTSKKYLKKVLTKDNKNVIIKDVSKKRKKLTE